MLGECLPRPQKQKVEMAPSWDALACFEKQRTSPCSWSTVRRGEWCELGSTTWARLSRMKCCPPVFSAPLSLSHFGSGSQVWGLTDTTLVQRRHKETDLRSSLGNVPVPLGAVFSSRESWHVASGQGLCVRKRLHHDLG